MVSCFESTDTPDSAFFYAREPGALHRILHPGDTAALARLIEYTVATYGRERLHTLMTSLGQYASWETLLPAVFGMSAAEFEAGWHTSRRTMEAPVE